MRPLLRCCSRCREVSENFAPTSYYCRPCQRAWDKERQRTHPEYHAKRLAKTAAYKAANLDAVRAQNRARKHERYHSEPEYVAAQAARAKQWRTENSAKVKAAYKAWSDANRERINARARAYAKAHPEYGRESAYRHRARKQAAFVERVDFAFIWERDGGVCRLCHEVIDVALRWPDPQSVSLDHIVALANGGGHEPANVQLAHVGCNARKGRREEAA